MLAAALLAGLVVIQVLGLSLHGAAEVAATAAYDLVFLLSAVACILRGRRIPEERGAWTLIGVGLLLSGLGYAYDSITTTLLGITPSFPGPADFLWFCLYPFLYVGVLRLVKARTGQGSRIAADGALAALALASVAAAVLVPQLSARTGADLGTIITNVVYPLADIHLFCFVLWTGALGGRRLGVAWPVGLAVLGGAIVVDAVYLVQITTDSYHGGLLELGWPAAAVGYAWLAFLPRSADTTPVRERAGLRLAIPIAASLVATALVVREALEEDPQLILAAATLIASVARAARVAITASRLEHEVESSGVQLAEAQRLASAGSFEYDVTTGRAVWSDELWRIHGLEPNPVAEAPESTLAFVHAEDRDKVHSAAERCLAGAGDFEVAYRIERPDGEVRQLEMRGTLIAKTLRASVQDVTQRKQMESELRRAAEEDSLTGLCNRSRFEAALDERSVQGGQFAVALVDLDHIKFVNDSFGHAAGDELLCHAAQAISRVLRQADLLARFGGDEFIILLPDVDKDAAVVAVEHVLQALRDSRWRGAQRQTASAGIALAALDQVRGVDDMLKAADIALYEAKDAGRDRCALYRGPDGGLAWVEEVRAAIDQERLVLYSQPIVPLRGGTPREELLVRMVDRDGELLPPSAFVPIAEQFGLICDLDLWVVRQALELARSGRSVEVNVSGASLGEAAIIACVTQAVVDGVDPALLVFEVTETAAVRNLDHARDFAESLTALGCGFALDDFGTGFGSLNYLRHLPITQIKIDVDFVRDLVDNVDSQRIVRAIVGIAESFGHETVAEGVEDIAAVELLREMGVDFAQGFALQRPAPVEVPLLSGEEV